MLQRVIPKPILTLFLTGTWLLLIDDFSLGTFILGLFLGLVIARIAQRFWPEAPRIKHPFKVAAYCLVVLWDIIVANVEVAYLVLFRRNQDLSPAFVSIPLDIRTPEAITVFAATIIMTPGTVTGDVSADRKSLLVHCLDAPDPDAVIRDAKERYEARLKEIFE